MYRAAVRRLTREDATDVAMGFVRGNLRACIALKRRDDARFYNRRLRPGRRYPEHWAGIGSSRLGRGGLCEALVATTRPSESRMKAFATTVEKKEQVELLLTGDVFRDRGVWKCGGVDNAKDVSCLAVQMTAIMGNAHPTEDTRGRPRAIKRTATTFWRLTMRRGARFVGLGVET